MKKRLFFGLLFLLIVSPIIGQEDTNPPFVYYYDFYNNAMIVERADGTDTRILGDGLMGDNINNILWSDWSATGQWLAWSGNHREYYSNDYRHSSWVVSVNGSQQPTALDRYAMAEMAWSPTDDILAVIGMVDEPNPNSSEFPLEIALIDVAQDMVISSTEILVSNNPTTQGIPFALQWFPDGRHLIIAPYDFITIEGEPQIYVADIEALTITKQNLPNEAKLRIIGGEGTIIYTLPPDDQYHLHNVITGETQEFLVDRWFNLSPNGQYGLVRCQESLCLLNRATGTITEITDIPLATNTYEIEFWRVISPWSHRSEFMLLLGNDHILRQFDIQTLTLTPLYENVSGWAWHDRTYIVMTIESDQREVIYILYDIESQSVQAEILGYGIWRFAPNGSYVAQVDANPIVYDLENNTTIQLRPHYARPADTIGYGGILWHPSGDWLITAESVVIAGGGQPFVSGVANATGSMRRDLTLCSPPMCINWLPPQVDVANLASVLPVIQGRIEPTQIFETDHLITQLEWSPDSQYIASGSGHSLAATYQPQLWREVWDIQSGEIIQQWNEGDNIIGLHWADDHIPVAEKSAEPTKIFDVSPDMMHVIAYYGDEDQVGVFDRSTDVFLYPLENARPGSYSFSSDGQWIAGLEYTGGQVKLWDAKTGQMLEAFNIYGNAVAFSPDGQWLAIGGSWNIRLYSMESLLQNR